MDKLSYKVFDNTTKENPVNIDNYDKQALLDYRLTLKPRKDFYVKFHCEGCYKEVVKNINYKKYCTLDYITYCKTCKTHKTNLEKYGRHPAGLKETINKRKETCLQKYGVDHYSKTGEYSDRFKSTCQTKYGVDYPAQKEDIYNKVKNTNKERYGCEYPLQNEDIQKKTKNTKKERYGDEHYNNSKQAKITNLDKYGVDSYVKSEDYKQYMINKFGTMHAYSYYKFNGFGFDSSWELAFYIYHKDNNHNIKHSSEISSFIYKYNNSIYNYFPDFKVSGRYYEIKGDQFIEYYKNGKVKGLICPYDSSLNGKYNQKYKCMKKHNVILINKSKIQKYLKYIIKNYGSLDYLENFKI